MENIFKIIKMRISWFARRNYCLDAKNDSKLALNPSGKVHMPLPCLMAFNGSPLPTGGSSSSTSPGCQAHWHQAFWLSSLIPPCAFSAPAPLDPDLVPWTPRGHPASTSLQSHCPFAVWLLLRPSFPREPHPGLLVGDQRLLLVRSGSPDWRHCSLLYFHCFFFFFLLTLFFSISLQ